MKTKYLLLFFLIAFLNFSCKKDEEKISPKTANGNPTSYRLKSQIWSGPTTNGSGFFYEYNQANLVSKIARHQWGTYSVNGGPVQRWDDTTYYYFEYTNGLCTKWEFKGKSGDSYVTYEYNGQNLPVKRTSYAGNNMIHNYSFYKYDTNGNLIEKTDSLNQVNSRYVFTYNQNNNLTSVTHYQLYQNPVRKEKYEYLSHDTGVNFIKAVNGLPLTFEWDNNFHSYSSTSPNNYLSGNHYWSVEINQPYGTPNSMNYSFEYNDEGLPTKMRYAPWLVTFEYDRF